MRTVIVGAGGHARVVYDILRTNRNVDVVGFTDRVPSATAELIFGVPIIGAHDVIENAQALGIRGVTIAIGDNELRGQHFRRAKALGLEPVSAIHPTAVISPTARIGEGCVIGPAVTIGTLAVIGDNAIINTGAIVEHEVEVGEHSHIAPGSVIAGRVKIGAGTLVGAGSVVKEYVSIGDATIIGAGSVVLNDLPSNCMAAGTPATVRRQNGEKIGRAPSAPKS